MSRFITGDVAACEQKRIRIMSIKLCPVAVLRISAILQDCSEQLAVLGNILSGTYTDKHTTVVLVDISRGQQSVSGIRLQDARGGVSQRGGVHEVVQELQRTQREVKQSSPQFIINMQNNRKLASLLIGDLLTELKEEGTFNTLIHTVDEEKKTKAQLQEILTSDEEDHLKIKALQKQLHDLTEDTAVQIQEREQIAAHLEDQLQEWKVTKSLQEKYMTSSTQLMVLQGQKMNNRIEKQLEVEIKILKQKLEEEEKDHIQLETFLKKNQTSLEEMLEYWMDCYDKDTEDKQRELNTVKTNKSNNLAQLQELAKKYRDNEQVIIDDRLEKEELQRQREHKELEEKAAVKLQAWWRGTLVRKCLGPYGKQKKPQQKKGKKGKKKKKK